MGNGIYVATAGAVAQSQALDVVANNISNASSIGFHAERVRFGVSRSQASGDSIYMGVSGTQADNSVGALIQTDSPLDVAISGDAYFSVNTPNGLRYTRAGNFRLDETNKLVNAEGLPVSAKGGGDIVLPPGTRNIEIDKQGNVFADGNAVSSLALTRFSPGSLTHESNTLYVAAPGTDIELEPTTQVVSGILESSNFNAVRGIVDMIKISRTYEALHRMLDTYKQVDQRTARDVGGPG